VKILFIHIKTKFHLGFITVKGGHRVGISGSCVIENGKVININYIYSLNFRIAKEVTGCANNVLKEILKLDDSTIYNCLIISKPGARKNNYFKRFSKAVIISE
jgi:stage III sporulation protein AA